MLGFIYTGNGVRYSEGVDKDSGGGDSMSEDNGFLEYLQLQGSDPVLVTKSELIANVREHGYSLSDRQLTFYVSEGLVPKSVRVGSRAGVYPRIVVDLLSWVLRCKAGGLPIEAIRELLPIWKYLTRARKEKRIDLGELEYIARQHVTMLEGSYALPLVVSDVLHDACKECRAKIVVVFKDGSERKLDDPSVTVGFAIAQRGDDVSDGTDAKWITRSRLALGGEGRDVAHDPTTLILGIRPGEALPPEEPKPETPRHEDPNHDEILTEETV